MARRGKYEGTIRFIKAKKLWRARITVHGKTKDVYGKTRAEAVAKLDELRDSKKKGMGLIQHDMKFKELADMWFDTQAKFWTNHKTRESYFTPVRLILLPHLQNKRLSEINNPAFLNGFFSDTLVDEDKTANQIGRAFKSLHHMFDWAIARNLLGFNKCERNYIQLPKHLPKEKPLLDMAEIKTLRQTLQLQPKSALWLLMFSTGIRVMEALGLSTDDIDFENNMITIRHQLVKEAGVNRLVRVKQKSMRRIPVDEVVIDLLLEQLGATDNLNTSLTNKGIAWSPTLKCDCCKQDGFRLVFLSQAGTPLDYDNLRARDWTRTMKSWDSNIELTIHDLRHIFASVNLTNGTDVVTVSKLLGHANPSITLKVYASYINPPNQDQVASFMASLLTD